MKSLIQKLVEVPGPSGYESQIREVVRAEIEALVDEVKVDSLGNLIARLGQKGPVGLRVMLAAHIDEIGIMVTHVDEHGFARFTNLGGVRPHTLMGGRVRFLSGAQGVIGSERVGSISQMPGIAKMYIDLGVTRRQDCPVAIGDVAAFERPFLDMGNRLVSKAMDDRIGVAILIEALRRLRSEAIASPHELYFVFSVQEEVGVRGATTAAFGVDPDLGLAVDITPTGDTPHGIRMDVALGKGPAVKVRDQRMLSDPRVVDWMVKTAKKAKLPYQMEILERGGTDARAIQLTRRRTGWVYVNPMSLRPFPSEMVDFGDVQHAVSLLIELLRNPVKL